MAKKYDYNTFVFKKEVYPKVKVALDKNGNKLLNAAKTFFDKNSNVLTSTGMGNRLLFSDILKVELFKFIEYNPKDIKQKIEDTKITEKSWILYNKPENWTFILLIKYFSDRGKENDINIILMYYTCYLYSSLQYKYFEHVNQNVMDYTINNLSNKYDIKRLGNLQRALFKLTTTCYETYKNYFTELSDLHIKDYSMNLWTRINNMIKAVAEEYYKNLEEGNYLNKETDNNDEDNYYEVENISSVIENLTSKSVNYVIGNGLDFKLANLSAKMCDVSQSIVRSCLENIIKNNIFELNVFYNSLLQRYFITDKGKLEELASKNFIIYCNHLYTKGRSIDDNILKIKGLLDKWLKENSEKYNKTEREATRNNFRKAIYFYFILILQKVESNR